jgi:hypothetical protein
MAYSLAVAQLTVDGADSDGVITAPSVGRDWAAMEPNDDAGSYSPDVGGQYGWHYNGQLEYIKALGGIAPVGRFTPADMALSAWQVEGGLWDTSSCGALLRKRLLHYYDGATGRYAAGEYGRVKSIASFLNCQAVIWHLGAASTETEPPVIIIELTNPSGNAKYGLLLPGAAQTGAEYEDLTGINDPSGAPRQYTQPQLIGMPHGESAWSVIAGQGAGSGPTGGAIGKEPKLRTVRIEYADGTILIGSDKDSSPWAYSGEWVSSAGATVERLDIAPGPVRVTVIGHTAMVGLYPLEYPASVALRPHRYWFTGALWPTTQTYRVVGGVPAGTSITVAEETVAPNGSRPVVTFASADHLRPILYAVQEARAATLDTVTPEETFRTQGSTTFALLQASGEIGEDYRGSTLQATVTARNGAAYISDIRPNAKVAAMVNVHDGDAYVAYDTTDAVTGYQYATLFTGYMGASTRSKGPGTLSPTEYGHEVTATDVIEARLQKKAMGFQCSFEGNGGATGWNIVDAFHYLLHAGGIPDALISVDASITAGAMGASYYLPSSTKRGSRKLQFNQDCTLAAAIDELVSVVGVASVARPGGRRGLQWGVLPSGVVFLRPAYEHVAGSYDYTFDDDTATVEDMGLSLRSTRGLDDFCNLLWVMVGEGVDAAAKVLVDYTSWQTSTSVRYIGDLWAQYHMFPDGTDLEAIASELWERLARWTWMISVEMDDCPWIMPHNDLRVYASNLWLPQGSIFKVVSKGWSTRAGGRYTQTLECALVEEAA